MTHRRSAAVYDGHRSDGTAPASVVLPRVRRSVDHHGASRGHLPPALVDAALVDPDLVDPALVDPVAVRPAASQVAA